MFCQMVPMFVNDSVFAVQSVNNPDVNLGVSIVALVANIAALAYIVYRAKKLGVNPYKQEVFVGTKDFQKAGRRADTAYLRDRARAPRPPRSPDEGLQRAARNRHPPALPLRRRRTSSSHLVGWAFD